MMNYGSLAQSVEQRTFNPLVARSNRARPTNRINGLMPLIIFSYYPLFSCRHPVENFNDSRTTCDELFFRLQPIPRKLRINKESRGEYGI